jgi:8-oxo-dGTP diphosphatase
MKILSQVQKERLKKKTGLHDIEITQFKTFGKPGRDPRGRTISIVYYTIIENEVNIEAGDDAAKAEWFPLDELPELAFDHQENHTRFYQRFKITLSNLYFNSITQFIYILSIYIF